MGVRSRMGWMGAIAAIGLAGCHGGGETAQTPTAMKSKPAPVDPWVLTCVDPNATEPALLWNGLIGVRIGRDGTGIGGDGKPLPMFAIDEYEKTGEEKIVPQANPLVMKLAATSGANREALDPRKGTAYSQRVNMHTGELTTEWQQKVGDANLKIRCETYIHPGQRALAQKWHFETSAPVNLSLENGYKLGPESDGAHRLPTGRLVKLHADWEGGNEPSSPQSDHRAPVTGASIDYGIDAAHAGDATWTFALDALPQRGPLSPSAGSDGKPMPPSFELPDFPTVETASKETWAERWKTDIEIDGPIEDQQAVRSFLFYLRSAIHPDGKMAVSPFGLSNQMYNGHVFWDADIWAFPALMLIDPKNAAAIPEYRLARSAQARDNAKAAIGRSNGMKYPWESSVTGKETVPGPSQKELHITGSALWALNQATELGLLPNTLPANAAAAGAYYRAVSKKGPNGLELADVMSPDENHIGSNDLYTNLLASWVDNLAAQKSGSALWQIPAYKLPKDDKTFLTYDNDALRGYKQAAAVLSIYPLQYPPAEAEAKAMMDRFADKVNKSGPAMTDSIHSIIWSRLGEQQKAYDAWRASWQPFTTGPLMLFSEKRTKPASYFVTGAAGSLQAIVFGFCGFRVDYKKEPGAAWATQLKGDSWLTIKPNLPSQWKSVKFKNFAVLGHRYTLDLTRTAAHVTSGE